MIAVITLVVTIFVYSVISSSQFHYNTHFVEYNYGISAAYKSGSTPASMLMLVYIGLIILFLWCMHQCRVQLPNITKESHCGTFCSTAATIAVLILRMTVMVIIIGIYCLITIGYIYMLNHPLNFNLLVFIQLLVALFFVSYLNLIVYPALHAMKSKLFRSDRDFLYSFIILKFSCYVLVPVFVSIFTDVSCFNYLIAPPSEVIGYYKYSYCKLFDNTLSTCLIPAFPVQTTVFSPIQYLFTGSKINISKYYFFTHFLRAFLLYCLHRTIIYLPFSC